MDIFQIYSLISDIMEKQFTFINTDKLTARDARDQLIAGGCFAAVIILST